MNYLVRVEYPHEYTSGFSFHEATLEEAKRRALEFAKGKSGHSGYTQVSIYQFIEKVN